MTCPTRPGIVGRSSTTRATVLASAFNTRTSCDVAPSLGDRQERADAGHAVQAVAKRRRREPFDTAGPTDRGHRRWSTARRSPMSSSAGAAPQPHCARAPSRRGTAASRTYRATFGGSSVSRRSSGRIAGQAPATPWTPSPRSSPRPRTRGESRFIEKPRVQHARPPSLRSRTRTCRPPAALGPPPRLRRGLQYANALPTEIRLTPTSPRAETEGLPGRASTLTGCSTSETSRRMSSNWVKPGA